MEQESHSGVVQYQMAGQESSSTSTNKLLTIQRIRGRMEYMPMVVHGHCNGI